MNQNGSPRLFSTSTPARRLSSKQEIDLMIQSPTVEVEVKHEARMLQQHQVKYEQNVEARGQRQTDQSRLVQQHQSRFGARFGKHQEARQELKKNQLQSRFVPQLERPRDREFERTSITDPPEIEDLISIT
jgi:hypothetical protein